MVQIFLDSIERGNRKGVTEMEGRNDQKEEEMPESASSPISQEISPSTDTNATTIPPSRSQTSPPSAPASTAIDPSKHANSSAPVTSPSANASSSNSTTQPDTGGGGGQSVPPPKASSAPPPLNKASPPPPPLPPPPPPPPSPASFLPPNDPPSSPVPTPSESNPPFSPPPSPQSPSKSSPESKAPPPPVAPVLSPPPTRETPNSSPPVQVVTPATPVSVTPSIPTPPDSLIPINISPPKPSTPDSPIPQSIPVKPTPSTYSGGEAPTHAPQGNGNSISTNAGSSATVPYSSHVSPSHGVVIAATVGGAVIAFIAILLVVFVKRKRRTNGLKKQYRPTPNSSIKRKDEHLQKKVSNLGERHLKLVGYDVSGATLSASAGETSYESNGGYGCLAGAADAAGARPWFTYEELMDITNGFSHENKIGEGGFGSVFRGSLPDGRTVAVKQLKVGSGQGEREFKAEVEIIGRIHHRHLVSLVGYCISEHHRLLVYEFVPNKTLEHHLHVKEQLTLDWQKRIKIALGSARGLVYLHEYCHPRIIHRDIKSANILLDNSFEAMVADFGLAKLTSDTSTHVSTRVMGTFGYMAPEYAASGKLTEKSDVFSFGVVLLELIAGRKPVDISRPQGEESLVEWARPLLVHAIETGDCEELIDPKLGNNFPKAEMLRMIEVAASCVRHSAVKRPRMAQVLRALENNEDVSDISNGVKVGESVAYNSGQYSADIRRFQRLAFGTREFSSAFGPSKE